MKKKVNYLCLFILFLLILTNSLSVFAATPIEKTLSYDGVTGYANENSWTTDRGVKEINQYEEGTRVTLTTTKTIRNLNTGEHYYKTLKDEATIGYWEVFHKPAQCIHDTNHMNYAKYYGFTVKNYDCHKFYNSGWLAFCVDCGERFEFLVYANKNTISNIKTMPASGHYVFLCPWCDGVEQAISYEHYCNAISNNRYKIKYHRNNPSDATVGGYMAETKHMYNNATIYDGKATNYTDTNLRKNSFSCIGYTFKGWNTKPD